MRGMHFSISREEEDYGDGVLDVLQDVQREMRESMLQRANVGAVIITFVFMFEVDFVGNNFPASMGVFLRILPNYMPSVSILLIGNFVLILSLILLLFAMRGGTYPRLGSDDYFGRPESDPSLNRQLRALRYALLELQTDETTATATLVRHAYTTAAVGLLLGTASVLCFLTDGGAARAILGIDVPSQAKDMHAWFGAVLVVGICCIVCYALLTRELRAVRTVAAESGTGVDGASYSPRVKQLQKEYLDRAKAAYESSGGKR